MKTFFSINITHTVINKRQSRNNFPYFLQNITRLVNSSHTKKGVAGNYMGISIGRERSQSFLSKIKCFHKLILLKQYFCFTKKIRTVFLKSIIFHILRLND